MRFFKRKPFKNVERGYFLLVDHKYAFIAWLIKIFQRNRWNHVAWFINSEEVVEAGFKKVRRRLASKYNTWAYNTRVRKIKDGLIKKDDLEKAIKEAESRVGLGYDWLQAITMGILYLFGKTDVSPIDLRNKFICSELIAEPLESSHFYIVDNVPVRNIFPRHFDDSIKLEDVEVGVK